MIWETPIYRFRIPDGRSGRKYRYKEIVIDVTGSAPGDEVPGKLLGRVLDEGIQKLHKDAAIIDFGAGKLRNALYLMKKKFRVYAVEFQNLTGRTPQAKELWEAAKGFGKKFNPIILPHEFVGKHREEFDLGLIINTLSVMPVPAERLLVLAYLHASLKTNGHLLWYALKGDEDQTNRCHESAVLGDGYYTGVKKKIKQFWREYRVEEVDEMMQATGFRYVSSFNTQGNSQARLYQRDLYCPLEPALTLEFVEAGRQEDDRNISMPQTIEPRTFLSDIELDPIVPNPREVGIDRLCIESLRKLKAERTNDHRYHRLVAFIFRRLFFPDLRNQKVEEKVGTGRTDIVMTNDAVKGFFHAVRSAYNVFCPLVFVECKNYGTEVANTEISQLLQRMNPKRGCLGFLAYRTCKNRVALIQRCIDAVGANNYILALSDQDLIDLLEMRHRNEIDDIQDYLDTRLKEIVGVGKIGA